MFHEMSEAEWKACTDRPALPFFGMRSRDQSARVDAFRNLMKEYPIEIITSGHCGPIMGPVLEPTIEKLLTVIGDSSKGPRFLNSQADEPHLSGGEAGLAKV